MRSILIYIVVVLFGVVEHLQSQDVTFTASVENTTVQEGQQFQVTYTLSGGDLKNYSDFSQPNLNKDFLTIAGPSTSQQMSIINGKVSASISWIYVLQPRKKGTFTIQGAMLKYNGDQLQSNSLRIRVVAGTGNSGRQSAQSNGDEVDLGDNLMLRAIPDKREVYLGEPIRVTYKLYSRVDFQLENIVKIPRSVGFWSEELEAPRRLERKIEVYNGKQYQTFLVRKVVYFPTQSGELYIEPFEINAVVAVRVKRKTGDSWRDKFFSDPFFDSYKNVRKAISSTKIGVSVIDLPEQDKPDSFKGAVGVYSMDVSLDRTAAKANETIALNVKIHGTGNIKLLSEPHVTIPSGIDKYDPNVTENYSPLSGSITGDKTFEYILIPRFPGKLELPPVEFSYFDLQKQEYVTLKSELYDLDIQEGEALADENQPHAQRIKYLSMDIQPLKTDLNDLHRGSSSGPSLPIILLMYLFPGILAVVGIAWKRRYDRLHDDIAGLQMRRASRTAEKHLAASRRFLNQNDTEGYYQEIARALWGYIQHKFGILTSDTSIASVSSLLSERGMGQNTIEKVVAALNSIEYARFSPTRAEYTEKNELYDRARMAIISIEQSTR